MPDVHKTSIGIRLPMVKAPRRNTSRGFLEIPDRTTYNVYCDESCYLEHDDSKVMVLGALWCPLEKTREIAQDLRTLKELHGLPPHLEVKWTKVSPAKVKFYLDVVDYFFDTDALQLRALIVPDKTRLRHEDFKQNHDDWYHKMYYQLLEPIVDPENSYRIYVDVKDTWSTVRFAKLQEVLRTRFHDPWGLAIQRLQVVQSKEIEQSQLTDLLIGAVAYVNRGLTSSDAKLALVRRMQQRSGLMLQRSTARTRRKVNIFVWQPWDLDDDR